MRGRSRSPRQKLSSSNISKAVAMFGRYPDKRPAGLYVDETSSSFFLNDLMQCWGDGEGLSRDDPDLPSNHSEFPAVRRPNSDIRGLIQTPPTAH